jgi:hypothetical protein
MPDTDTCINVQIVLNLLEQIMNLQGKEIHNQHKEAYLGVASRRPRFRCCSGLKHPWTRQLQGCIFSGWNGDLQETGMVDLNGDC